MGLAWLKFAVAHAMGQDCPKCKETPLTVNVIDFEFFGFNVSIWVPWSPLGPKKS